MYSPASKARTLNMLNTEVDLDTRSLRNSETGKGQGSRRGPKGRKHTQAPTFTAQPHSQHSNSQHSNQGWARTHHLWRSP